MLVVSTLKLELVFGYRDFSKDTPDTHVFVTMRDANGAVPILQAVWEGIPKGKKKDIVAAARENLQGFLKDKDFLLLPVAPTFEEPEVNTSSARLYFRIMRK